MVKRILLMLLVVMLALAPTAVFAHSEMPPVFCGDLSEKDCDLLKESQAVMMEVTEQTSTGNMIIRLANIPGSPVKDAAVSIDINLISQVDPEMNKRAQEFVHNAADALAEDMQGFMQDYTDFVVDIYNSMGLDMELTIELSDELAAFASEQAGIELPNIFNLDVRLLDGFLYFNLSDIASSLPDLGIPEGWMGLDFVSLLEQEMASSTNMLESSGEDAQAMMAGLNIGLAFSGLNNNEELLDMFNDFVSMERLPDGRVGNTRVAEVQGTVDFAAMFSNSTLIDLIMTQIEASGASQELDMEGMNPEELVGMLQLVAPMVTQGMEWTQIQRIGIDDGYLYGSEVAMNWDMSAVLQLAAMGQGQTTKRPKANERPTFELSVVSENSDFDDAPDIEAPEDAQLIPLEALDTME
jgi:hypothetical protein